MFRYILRLANLSPLYFGEYYEDCQWAVLQILKGKKKKEKHSDHLFTAFRAENLYTLFYLKFYSAEKYYNSFRNLI